MKNDTSIETTLFEDDLLKIVRNEDDGEKWCVVWDNVRNRALDQIPGSATAEQVKFARHFFDMGYSLGADRGREMIQSELRELLGIHDETEEE